MYRGKIIRTTALMLAFLMLATSSGLSIDFHFCKGTLKSFNAFGKAQPCHVAKMQEQHCTKGKSCCSKHKKAPVVVKKTACTKGCCKNKTIDFPSEKDIVKAPATDLSSLQSAFIIAFGQAFWELDVDIPNLLIPHQNYTPPKLNRDVPLLVQSFLL